jgi:hypothetical protein
VDGLSRILQASTKWVRAAGSAWASASFLSSVDMCVNVSEALVRMSLKCCTSCMEVIVFNTIVVLCDSTDLAEFVCLNDSRRLESSYYDSENEVCLKERVKTLCLP